MSVLNDPAAVLEVDDTLRRLGGDMELLSALYQAYVEDAPMRMAELEAAVASGVAEEVASVAHTIKGACAAIGAEQAREWAFKLETAGRENRSDEFETLKEHVNQQILKVMEHLGS